MGALLDAPLIETAIVPDIFVSGVAYTEHIGGGCLRHVLYANEMNHRLLVAKIVMSARDALVANAAVRHSFHGFDLQRH